MGMDEDNDDGLGGRSRRRREVTATARFAADLIKLPDWHLAEVPLPDHVREAVDEGRRIGSPIARKRQLGFIDGLLRALELEEQQAIAVAIRAPKRAKRQQQDRIGGWRRRLLDEGDEAVEALLSERPELDRQRVRQLVRNAKKGAVKPLDDLIAGELEG